MNNTHTPLFDADRLAALRHGRMTPVLSDDDMLKIAEFPRERAKLDSLRLDYALSEIDAGLDAYQRRAGLTAAYPNVGSNVVYPTLGLAGEAGEVANKVKKIQRDFDGVLNDAARRAIASELGDVMWYVAQTASECGLSLGDIALENLAKLADRQARGTLRGSGDDR